MFRVRFGEDRSAVFNANCDCDILLDYIRRRAVKDLETFGRDRDSVLRAAQRETEAKIAAALDDDDAQELSKLQALRNHQRLQVEALENGLAKFNGLQDADFSGVDLQDADGNYLQLYADPKRRATDLLANMQLYTLAKRDLVPTEEAGPEYVMVPLIFEIPDDPVA